MASGSNMFMHQLYYPKKFDGLSDTDTDTETTKSYENVLLHEFDNDLEDVMKSVEQHEDKTILAGNRLYGQALDQHRRLKERREMALASKTPQLTLATKSELGQKVRLYVSKTNHEVLKNRASKAKLEERTERKTPDIETLKAAPVPERCQILYELSSDKQLLGRQKRYLIEDKQARAKMVPETKLLPKSQASDMYYRSLERLEAKEEKLAALAQQQKKMSNCQ